jgi:hypothetical protein
MAVQNTVHVLWVNLCTLSKLWSSFLKHPAWFMPPYRGTSHRSPDLLGCAPFSRSSHRLAIASETPRPQGRTLSTQSIQFIQRSAPTHDRKRAALKGSAFVHIANTAVMRKETRVDLAEGACSWPFVRDWNGFSVRTIQETLRLRYEPNRLMLRVSIGLWRWYINVTITILDIIHYSVFYLKLDSNL